MSGPNDRVAIVGGGFSGAMLAARLAERGVASALINRTGDFGLGVAYSTAFDGHLLNVRSARMSAVADRPDDFVAWLRDHHPDLADPDDFVPRKIFGRYVQDRLKAIEAARPGLITRIVGQAVALEPGGVRLASGEIVAADRIVLATGNPAPRTAAGVGASRVIADPWAAGALSRIKPQDDLIVLGTGLTMVDVLLALEGHGWRGHAVALSRRGLLPRAHGDGPDPAQPPTPALTEGPLSRRLAEARRMAEPDGWRTVMEGLRPITAALWTQAAPDLRRRMVRHLRPWWDVHRHRLAPSVAARVQALIAADRLRVEAGRVRAIDEDADGVRVDRHPRHGSAPSTLAASWLIDCTGPGHAPDADPLTAPLIASGRARLDPLRLGLELDGSGRVVDANGRADPALFVLGPPARGAFWETIAVPDIRKRIEDVVQALTA